MLKPTVLVALAVSATLCAVPPLRANDSFKTGSEWTGVLKELKQSSSKKKAEYYSTDFRLVVKKREGHKIEVEYFQENGKLAMRAEGTITDKGVVKFTPTKEIRGKWPKDLIGSANFELKLKDRSLTGTMTAPTVLQTEVILKFKEAEKESSEGKPKPAKPAP